MVFCSVLPLYKEISRAEHTLEHEGVVTDKEDILDKYQEWPVRLMARALVPAKEHPKVRYDDSIVSETECSLSTARRAY